MRDKRRLFIAMVTIGALLGTMSVMAAEQPELPTKVQSIAKGSDDIYGEGVPLEHGANPDKRFSSGGIDVFCQVLFPEKASEFPVFSQGISLLLAGTFRHPGA